MSRVFKHNSRIFLETDDLQRFYYEENRNPLGSGAMGTVYLGYRYGTTEPVAIKRVKDSYSNIPSIRERAKLEASFQFSHPNLVEMLGYCEVQEGHGPIFIISKFVSGDTIDQFVNKHLRSFPDSYIRICHLCFPVFDALDYIHRAQNPIVHADIKPSNIMVESGRNVRLMDLGIAQVNVYNGSSGTTGMMGTPRYAAPEQFSVSATSNKLNARTDIYELGVTIYELLAKRNPFDGKSLDEIKKKHSSICLPYISGVPKIVVDVLRKATMPSATDRYSSALQFKEALKDALEKKQPVYWPWILAIVIVLLIIMIYIFYYTLFI